MITITSGDEASTDVHGSTNDWLQILDDKELNCAPHDQFSARSDAVIKLETLNDWRLKCLMLTIFASFIVAMVLVMSPLGIAYNDTSLADRECEANSDRNCWVTGGHTLSWLGRVNEIDYETAFSAVLLEEHEYTKVFLILFPILAYLFQQPFCLFYR